MIINYHKHKNVQTIAKIFLTQKKLLNRKNKKVGYKIQIIKWFEKMIIEYLRYFEYKKM